MRSCFSWTKWPMRPETCFLKFKNLRGTRLPHSSTALVRLGKIWHWTSETWNRCPFCIWDPVFCSKLLPAYIWCINNGSISRWCAVTAGCRACTVWCSGVKPPNQQSSSEHAVLVWMCLPSCLWMLSQHAETRGRCSNGIANDIVRFPREPSRLPELLTASLFSYLIYCLPHHSPPSCPAISSVCL